MVHLSPIQRENKSMQQPIYSVVIPAYNEQEVISETYKRLTAVMTRMGEPYELIFVNDGSKDQTAHIIAGF